LNGLKIGDKWIKGMIKKGISKFIPEDEMQAETEKTEYILN